MSDGPWGRPHLGPVRPAKHGSALSRHPLARKSGSSHTVLGDRCCDATSGAGATSESSTVTTTVTNFAVLACVPTACLGFSTPQESGSVVKYERGTVRFERLREVLQGKEGRKGKGNDGDVVALSDVFKSIPDNLSWSNLLSSKVSPERVHTVRGTSSAIVRVAPSRAWSGKDAGGGFLDGRVIPLEHVTVNAASSDNGYNIAPEVKTAVDRMIDEWKAEHAAQCNNQAEAPEAEWVVVRRRKGKTAARPQQQQRRRGKVAEDSFPQIAVVVGELEVLRTVGADASSAAARSRRTHRESYSYDSRDGDRKTRGRPVMRSQIMKSSDL